MKKFSFIFTLLLLAALPLQAITGSGTAAKPYQISSADDWSTFASNVNEGINATSYYELTADISVSTMAGLKSYPFKGNFNGRGHTITITISTSSDVSGPFRYVEAATIVNTTVTGTISTSKMNAGGFIGRAINSGTSYLMNCVSDVTINSTVSGDGSHGGFIGVEEGSAQVNFTDCAFTGSLLGSSTTCCGGYVGWRGGTCYYDSCLFAPSQVTFNTTDSYTFTRRNSTSIKNCYYTQAYGTKEGEDASGMTNEALLEKLGDNWVIRGSKVLPIQGENLITSALVSDIQSFYSYSGSNLLPDYDVKLSGISLTEGSDFTETIMDSEGNTVTAMIEKGHYTLLLTGKGNYIGVKKITVYVTFTGSGTDGTPYTIESMQEWNDFVYLYTYCYSDFNKDSGDKLIHFQLTKDIDFGSDSNNFTNITTFYDYFDGNDHTLSGIIYGAPIFDTVSDSKTKIVNLKISNTTIDHDREGGSIAGINNGSIENCHVSDSVYVYGSDSQQSGNAAALFCHGGIAGRNKGTVSGCTSAATVFAKNSGNYYYGGIVGYNEKTIKYCFYNGPRVWAPYNYGAISGNSGGTITLCLYNSSDTGLMGANGSDITGAARGYVLTTKSDGLSLAIEDNTESFDGNTDIQDDIITAIPNSNLLIVKKTIYAPAQQELNITFTQKNLSDYISDDTLMLTLDYLGMETEPEITIIDVDNSFTCTFTMPSFDVGFYSGYKWTGSGTEATPYIISNLKQMDFLALRVNILQRNYSGSSFQLQNDLNLDSSSENNYTAIGGYYDEAQREFCGTFDGNDKTISGINISKRGSNDSDKYQGLFGIIGSGGSVKNLTLENSSINAYFAAGGIAGLNSGSIENCNVERNVTISSDSYSSCYGGIAGYNCGSIDSCASEATVSNTTAAGGIAGYNKEGSLSNCLYIAPALNSTLTSITSTSYGGSLIGRYIAGTLNSNYYINSDSTINAIGLANSSTDRDGACRLYIITSDVGNISFAENSEGFTYNSVLYAAYGNSISINGDFSTSNITYGISSTDGTILSEINASDSEASFKMPAYNVTIRKLAKVTFESNGGSSIESQLIQIGQNPNRPTENPVNSACGVFDNWYTDSSFSEVFDFNTEINVNLTLYAKYVTGINISAKEDPYTSGTYYTTFYSSSKNYKADSNTEVYYASDFSEGKAFIEKEESKIINAGKGVILKSTSSTISLALTDSQGSYSYGNILSGTDEEITAGQEIYTLGLSDKGGVGFYKWSGSIAGGKAFIDKANLD